MKRILTKLGEGPYMEFIRLCGQYLTEDVEDAVTTVVRSLRIWSNDGLASKVESSSCNNQVDIQLGCARCESIISCTTYPRIGILLSTAPPPLPLVGSSFYPAACGNT